MDVGNENLPYPGVRIKYIAAGNEEPDAGTGSILPAMQNLNGALLAAGRADIKVSTAVKMSVLVSSSPPSDGEFKDAYMTDVSPAPGEYRRATAGQRVSLLRVHIDNPSDIPLSYATFQPGTTTVGDNNGLTYTNLFDAMVDALYTAMEKAYNQNLINDVGNGTPKRPGPLETYIFAMFNENLKEGDETEKHFGLFNGPDKSPA
ncbi:hypothetical protein ACQ4PT_064294 [Festuca glaucescens]